MEEDNESIFSVTSDPLKELTIEKFESQQTGSNNEDKSSKAEQERSTSGEDSNKPQADEGKGQYDKIENVEDKQSGSNNEDQSSRAERERTSAEQDSNKVSADERKAHEDKIEPGPKPEPGSVEEKVSSLDWTVNRRNIVREMSKVTSVKEVQLQDESDHVLKDLGEYLVTNRKVDETYVATIYSCQAHDRDSRLIAKVIDMDNIDAHYRDHIKNYTFGVLWFVKKSSFKYTEVIHDIFLVNKTKLIVIENPLDFPLALIVTAVKRVKPKEARKFSEHLANGIFFLHNAGIAHQNISGWSVFVMPDKIVKLGCMEYATIYYDADRDEVRMQQASGKVPQLGFVAPEIYKDDAYDPTTADVYSFGAVVCYMILGHYPVDSKTEVDPKEQLNKTLEEIEQTNLEHLSNLVGKCLKLNPKERPTIRELVEHPWFSETLQ